MTLRGKSQSGRVELLQGTLDMLILRTLQWGPQHGHGISVAIRAGSNEVLQVEHGSLYPALHRLEELGLIAAFWGRSENNRRAKNYRIMRGTVLAGSRSSPGTCDMGFGSCACVQASRWRQSSRSPSR